MKIKFSDFVKILFLTIMPRRSILRIFTDYSKIFVKIIKIEAPAKKGFQ